MFLNKIRNIFVSKGTGKRGHIVAETLLLMTFPCARKLGNICCGHKMFLNKIRNIFVSRTQNLYPQQMLRARANGETCVSATMCPQQCVLVCQYLKTQNCVRNKCCACGQTGKHSCRQQCVGNNVSATMCPRLPVPLGRFLYHIVDLISRPLQCLLLKMSKIQMYYHMSVDCKRLLESTTVILTFSKPLRDKMVKCVVHLYSRNMFIFLFCAVCLLFCIVDSLRAGSP